MKNPVLSSRLSWLLCLLAVAFLACRANLAGAALFAYDPFLTGNDPLLGQYVPGDEDAGTNVLAGQNPTIGPMPFYTGGWIQSGGDSQVVKALPSLAYPGLPAGQGGLVQETVQFSCCSFGRSAREIAGGLGGPLVNRTVYQSFLIDFGSQGADDPTAFGKRAHELWNGGVGDAFLTVDLFLNHFSGVNDLTLQVNTPSGTQTVPVAGGGLNLQALAGTHLVVMKYDFNPVAADSVSVYLDPTSDMEPALPDAHVDVAASDLRITHHGAITNFTFSGGSHLPGAIDEIRWGDTFADVAPVVIPEPSALALASIAMVGAWRRPFRRIRVRRSAP
jgi:hypothetical protein